MISLLFFSDWCENTSRSIIKQLKYLFCPILITFSHWKAHLFPDIPYRRTAMPVKSLGQFARQWSNFLENLFFCQDMLPVLSLFLTHRWTCFDIAQVRKEVVMILSILLIALGFALLIAGADLLVRGSASLALRLKVPDLVIGLTVVAFGTSTPELVVS